MHTLRKPQLVVASLNRSPFRRKFRLSASERALLREQGLPYAMAQARLLVARALGAALPENEGKQTPFRGHPIYVAQHGTATCCRRCLEKWHQIPSGAALSQAQQDYVLEVIACWLHAQLRTQPAGWHSAPAAA